MQTECIADRFEFTAVEKRRVEAGFDGGQMTSDAGALLLGATDRAIGLIDRFASCFEDRRCQELVEHSVGTLAGQRVFGIALGYDDITPAVPLTRFLAYMEIICGHFYLAILVASLIGARIGNKHP